MSAPDSAIVRRPRRRLLFRLLLLLLVVIAVAAVIEIGLRLTGVLVRGRDAASGERISPDIHTVILCVGDSHTLGSRAPKGLDYPSQLEMQLNLADRVRGYRVVNLGRSGANSSMVLNQTVRYLAKAERTPDVIIFNAGFNNCWNFEEASVLPRNIAAGSLHAQFRYLAAQSRLLRFSRITVSRIEQLARSSESQISDAQSSQILNVHDETEIAFLTDWVYRDLVRLDREARGKGARLVLLSYWNNIRWVDAAFRRMTQTQGAPLIDVHNFGEPTTESWNTRPVALAAPDFHPNKYGYARIAQLVAQALFDRGLIPPAQAPKVR